MRPSPSLMRCLCRTSTSSVRPSVRATKHIPQPRPQTPQPSFLIRPQLAISKRHAIPSGIRYESTSATPAPPLSSTTKAPQSRLDRDQVPAYELTFTCKKCTTRSSHRVSKQGYHHGTVLITCPGCKNRHLISDHLKIFSDKPVTIEDLMREKGQLVKRGSLSEEGDVEFWDDGTTTARSAHFIPNTTTKVDENAEEGRLTAAPGSEEATAIEAEDTCHTDDGKELPNPTPKL